MSDAVSTADELIRGFLQRRHRYLWTDAFALTVLLRLEERALASRLVGDVHHALGRHRADDPRTGWISGLADLDGEAHPTAGGLRIGKPLPERTPSEPLDQDLEWERDGQYFHYLTKWAHALDQAAHGLGEPKYHVWARELMAAAHRAFVYGPAGERRMVWKKSIDLSRPLVSAMGHHDPLDGLVTCLELDASARTLDVDPEPTLDAAKDDFAAMVDGMDLATDDPLGVGSLLFDAARLAQVDEGSALLEPIIDAALVGIAHYARQPALPAHLRLAFRELGLAIGLAAVPRLAKTAPALADYAPLREEIEAFWLAPANRRVPSWADHRDINEVMLATSLLPEVFLRATAAR